MKKKASVILKQIVALVSSVAKAKSLAIKSKTSAVKARLIMFSMMKSKKVLLGSISDKIHTILGQDEKDRQYENGEEQSKAIVLYNNALADEDDKYPDLRHTLFDEEEEFNDPGGSVIDLVKNSKDEGEDFSLEDEIDHVADLFIMRFHKQMRLQKLESFKRFQEMLARSV
ncbi:uncharacterized protein LOC8285720 [Ricinus communis]|uniref:DUF761 domain-containing protein n=1 Tax=Ricinus communis TaxID=3988 RepID=B9RG28_RICCO|nr:uncharacterized protein LOC8285720 [Ricinus communis]EEF50149.1 hypothetical protein RCOM_1438750 [Ricinus communis]|eukprot:XP_002512697.1 uncharacterized protein LOC8285720 [Ricinus communis]